MSIPKTPPRVIQVGLHSILRLDDGEEESFDFPPEVVTEMFKAYDDAKEQPSPVPTAGGSSTDVPQSEPAAGDLGPTT